MGELGAGEAGQCAWPPAFCAHAWCGHWRSRQRPPATHSEHKLPSSTGFHRQAAGSPINLAGRPVAGQGGARVRSVRCARRKPAGAADHLLFACAALRRVSSWTVVPFQGFACAQQARAASSPVAGRPRPRPAAGHHVPQAAAGVALYRADSRHCGPVLGQGQGQGGLQGRGDGQGCVELSLVGTPAAPALG